MKELLKKKKKPLIISLVILLLLITSFLFLLIIPNRDALVRSREGSYFRARNILVAGPLAVMLASENRFRSRKKALAQQQSDFHLKLFTIKELQLIEFIETEEDTEDTGIIPPYYFGTYKIIAAAHRGILKLWVHNGGVYGSIRFPHWARGKTEYLKGVRIRGNNIRFTRSVTTLKEQRRIGSSAYFTQVYYGKYYLKGKKIKGYYTRNGHRGLWEANK